MFCSGLFEAAFLVGGEQGTWHVVRSGKTWNEVLWDTGKTSIRMTEKEMKG
jgi:hypothetical protein